MTGLVKAEFRKIFTTKMWWGLLIPAALITLGFTWLGAAFGSLEALRTDLGAALPTALPTFAVGLNFATIFPAIYGVTAISGEMRHKTITTSFLTGSSRGAVLAAKVIAYTGIGALYGVVCAVFGIIGALGGSRGSDFPTATAWLALCGTGVLAMVIWTLIGLGLGALIGSQVVAVLTLLLYTLLGERVITAVLSHQNIQQVPYYLPNAAGSGMTTDLALRLFFDNLPGAIRERASFEHFKTFLSLGDTPAWWISGLAFAGYALVLGLGGWWATRERDIT